MAKTASAKRSSLGLAVTFGGFDHEAEGLGPRDGRRVKTEVQKQFADARDGGGKGNADLGEAGEILRRDGEDKFVHARLRGGALRVRSPYSWPRRA